MTAVLRVDIISIFPGMFAAITDYGVTKRALSLGLWQLVTWDLRDFASNAYRTVDDRPYGGGPGMIMCPEPIGKAIEAARQAQRQAGVRTNKVICLSPGGIVLTDTYVRQQHDYDGLILLCGRYGGIDQRILDTLVDQEVSIGEYIVSGGELPAMVFMDAILRHIPGVLGDQACAQCDAFSDGLLSPPQYTRPEVYQQHRVPEVLLSGNHQAITLWRKQQALEHTKKKRPDLLHRPSS